MTKLNLFFIAGLFSINITVAQTEEKKVEKEMPVQFTLISPIGTNGSNCYKTTNKISINVFAGVSKGVNGFEGGGFANVVLKNVKGLQLAGFTNVVIDSVKGAQFAGYVNYSGRGMNGAAFAGFCNVNLGNLKGGQFAGFCNYNHKNAKGIQAAGFGNVTRGNFKGAQLSGYGNIAVGNVEGAQISGFFNYAKKVKGVQLGFVNIADSVDGASIGFFSFVKKGLHQIEVSTDEVFYGNLSFRTGSHKFYNIFSAGMSPKANGLLWHIGYGVGTSFRVSDRLRSDISLSAQHVSKGLLYNGTSELYKLYFGLEYKLIDRCFIAFGPTFNLYFGDTLLPDYSKKYSGIAPYSLLNETNSYGFNFKGWIGYKVAIRFL
jgi:hypothetical protein